MDSQAVIATTTQVISQIVTSLTPAAKAAYQAALIGVKVQALHSLTNDWGTVVGVFIPLILLILCACFSIFLYKKRDDLCVDAIIASTIILLFSTVFLVIAFSVNIGDLSNVFFDYQMYQHPDAYLAYQIMNKITGAAS